MSFRRSKLPKFIPILSLLILLVLGPIVFSFLQNASGVEAAWVDDNFSYRNAIPITSHTAAESNVYISATIDTSASGQFQSDCGDLRFTTVGGDILPYYIVSGCVSASTVVHVFFKSMPAGAQTIYYYYGNPSAANGFVAADFSTQAANYAVGSIGSQEKGGAPVAYWKFDDATGTTTQDSSPNNNDGTLTGATWQTEDMCISGKCLKFNGSADFVDAGDPTNGSLDFGTGAFSLSAWIKTGTPVAGSNSTIIGKLSSSGWPGYAMEIRSTNKAYFEIGGGTSITGTTNIVDNKWHHIATTRDGSGNLKLYVDGKQDANGSSSVSVDTSGKLRIGRYGEYTSPAYFNGFVDEPKIYNYARTAAQIKSDFKSRGTAKGTSVGLGSKISDLGSLSNGLVGYWKMDEVSGAGSTLADSSGNSNTGTAVLWGGGNTSTDSAHVAGKFGNSFSFDGGDDNVTVTDVASLQAGATMTVSAWFKLNATASDKRFVDKTNNGTGYALVANSTTPRFITGNGSTYDNLDGTTTLATGTWYHMVGTVENGTKRIFVNGNLENTASITFDGVGTGVNFRIGARAASQAVNASIDEIRLYNRALSPREVRDLYNWAPGPISYFPMEESTGTTTTDTSGGLVGTLTSGPTWTSGKYGKGIDFESTSDQYVTYTAGSTYNTAKANLTIGTWFKRETSVSGYLIANNGGYVSLSESGGNITGYVYPAGATTCTTSGITIINGNWHHLSLTWDGTTLKVYIDGKLGCTDTTTSGSITTMANEWRIGGRPSNVNEADGVLDDVKIYNYARTQKQIVEDMNAGHPVGGSPVGSQIGYWKMDEGYGPKASSTVWNQAGTTTNLVTNPSFETNLTNWNFQAGGGAGSFVADTTSSVFGSKNSKFSVTTVSSNYPRFYLSQGALSDGVTYTVSWYGKADTAGSTLRTDLQNSGNGTNCASSGTTYLTPTYTTSWTRYSFTFTFSATNCPGSTPILMSQYPAVQNYYFDGFQIEASSGSTPYCDGTVIGNGSRAWNGTAHASTSTCTYGQDGEINGPTWTNNGKYGKALSFDGSNDYVDVGRTIDLPTGAAFTVTAWINRTSGSGNYPVGWYQGTNGFLLYDTGTARVASGGTNYTTTTTLNTTGSWNYLVMVFDGSTLKTYHNGKAKDSISASYTKEGTGRLHIGNLDYSSGQTGFFNGLIDEVKIYNSALTSDEIALDYNRGQAMVLGTLSDTSGLTGGSVASSAASALYCLPGDTATCTPPVGEWNFEERSGQTVNDISGNGYSGTLGANSSVASDDPTWTDGILGKALRYDGSDDYVAIPYQNIGTALTYEVWFKSTNLDTTTDRNLFSYMSTLIRLRSNQIQWYPDVNLADTTVSTTVNNNRWNHLAINQTGTTYSVYLNGVLVSTGTTTSSVSVNTTSLSNRINSYAGTANLAGSIDDVRIYNYARSAAQVAWDYNQGKPIAQWKMDECQGGSIFDASGNGNTGTITIGASGTQTAVGTCTTSGTAWYNGVTGKFNSSLNFDGTDDNISVTDPPSGILDFGTNDFSVSAWIKNSQSLAADGDIYTIVGKFSDNALPGWSFVLRGNTYKGLLLRVGATDGLQDVTPTSSQTTLLSNGNWHHVFFRRTGGVGTLFIDGTNVGTGTSTKDVSNASNLRFGQWAQGSSFPFNGQIDDVRIYNYALTASQVKSIYNGGAAVKFGPATGSP